MENDELLKIIRERRSIRKYKSTPVPDELLMKILEAGRWAPSSENAQPWRFIVVKESETRKALGRIAGGGSSRRFTAEFYSKKIFERFKTLEDEEKRKRVIEKLTSGRVSAFLAEAPVVIVVCGKLDTWTPLHDCSAAIQNMLLMAKAIGLGSCWVAAPVADIRDEMELKEHLGVPDGWKIVSAVAVGYADEDPKPRPRYPLEETVFNEVWARNLRS